MTEMVCASKVSRLSTRTVPRISVIIPTHRRVSLLKHAIASVTAQTFGDWEMIVSVDDTSDRESLDYLERYALGEPRLRLTVNPGPHGQAGNVNHCLRLAQGQWIKPLFDDDRLLPNCLERFYSTISRFPEVALAGCLAKRYRRGRLSHVDRSPTRAYIEIVEQRHAHLAMYLQDFECGSMPTQMLIRADTVAKGALMPENSRLVSGIDQLWFADILRHGDRLHLAEVLVEEHQGTHETVTSRAGWEDLDNDSIYIRTYVGGLIPADVPRPSLEQVQQMAFGVRGLHRFFNRRFFEGVRLLSRVRSLVAVKLLAGWLARKLFSGYFCVTPRNRYDASR